MDPSSAPFKSPRPPAPRKARGATLSRQSSRQSLKDSFASTQDGNVPPLPASSAFGLGLDMGNSSNAMLDEDGTSIKHHNNNNVNNDNNPLRSNVTTQSDSESIFKPPKDTTASVLANLEGLLVAKSNEIQLAGRLGEALLSQQAELESRIRELEDEVRKNDDHVQVFGNGKRSKHYKSTRQRDMMLVGNEEENSIIIHDNDDDDDSDVESTALVDEKVKEKLKELELEMMKWEKGNEEIYKEVGVPSGAGSELVRQASSASMVSERRHLSNILNRDM